MTEGYGVSPARGDERREGTKEPPPKRRVGREVRGQRVALTAGPVQRGVHLVDLAAYIDKRRAAAAKECRQLTGTT